MTSLLPIGTFVVAKWPSTSNYYKSRIIDYTHDNSYVCQFLDGSIVALPAKYVDLPEKFQRITKVGHVNNEQRFVDYSLSFNSMLLSLWWIAIFLYAHHCFHHNLDLNGARIELLSHLLHHQHPIIVLEYLLLWFILQLVFARYFPHAGGEQLTYIKEAYPTVSYKHRSNSLLAFIVTSLIMCLFREKIPLRELTKSYYSMALFSLGIALAYSLIISTNKLFSRYCSLPVNE